ncbi:MAG: hypothetical protein ABFC24_09840 [Methanoregulaceae archaeon]
MPEVSRDDLGRRVFQLKKEKAAEAALDSIRNNLGQSWESLTTDDIAALAHILREMWGVTGRDVWGAYIFSSLTLSDVRALIPMGKDALGGIRIDREFVAKFERIMQHATS